MPVVDALMRLSCPHNHVLIELAARVIPRELAGVAARALLSRRMPDVSRWRRGSAA